MQVAIGLLSVLLGALAGGMVTLVTTRSKMRLELMHAHDQGLRDKRLEHYQKLFRITKNLPRYWRPDEEPTRQDLLGFCEEFHDWYFGEGAGGLFLTPQAMDLYMNLQNTLAKVGRFKDGIDDSNSSVAPLLSTEESKKLRELADGLRHQLALDIGTANPPRLRWTRLGPTSPPPFE